MVIALLHPNAAGVQAVTLEQLAAAITRADEFRAEERFKIAQIAQIANGRA